MSDGPATLTEPPVSTATNPTEQEAQTAFDAAKAARESGDFPAAEAATLRALALSRVLHGDAPHMDIATCHNMLGEIYGETHQYDRSISAFERALSVLRLLPANDEHVADLTAVLRTLAFAHIMNETPGSAAECLIERHALLEALPAAQRRPDTPEELLFEAELLRDLNREQDAIAALRLALTCAEDPDAPQWPVREDAIDRILVELHGLEYAAGDPEAALHTAQRLLALRRATTTDPAALADACDLCGAILRELGRTLDAADIYDEALRHRRAAHRGEDHADIAAALASAGITLSQSGQTVAALALLEEALAMHERLLQSARDVGDDEHADAERAYAASMEVLAVTLARLGRFGVAARQLEAALIIRQAHVTDDACADVALTKANLASVLYQSGDRSAAFPLLVRAIAIQRIRLERYGLADRFNTGKLIDSLIRLSIMSEDAGRFADAFGYVEEAVTLARQLAGGRVSPHLADALRAYAHALITHARTDEALTHMTQAVAIIHRLHSGRDHPELAAMTASYGSLLHDLGRSAEAAEHLASAASMYERLSGDADTFPLAEVLLRLAETHIALGERVTAVETANRAAWMFRAVARTSAHPKVLDAIVRAATVFHAASAVEPAIQLLMQCIEPAERIAYNHLHTLLTRLGWLLLSANRTEEALPILQRAAELEEQAHARSGGTELEQLAFASQVRDLGAHEGLAWAQHMLGNPVESVRAMERDRARTLRTLLERSDVAGSGGLLGPVLEYAQRTGDHALAAESQDLQAELHAAVQAVNLIAAQISAVSQSHEQTSPATERDHDLREPRDLLRAAQQHADTLRRRALALLDAHVPTDILPATVDDIRAMLGPNDGLMYFQVSPPGAIATLVTADAEADAWQPVQQRLYWPDGSAVTADSLEHEVGRYLASMQTEGLRVRGGVRREREVRDRIGLLAGHRLFSALFPEDLWQRVRELRVLYIIPDGSMQRLPIEALLVREPANDRVPAAERTYWIDEGPMISYAPSATVLRNRMHLRSEQIRRRSEGHRPRRELVALGDPVFQLDRTDRAQNPGDIKPDAEPPSGLRFSANLDPLPGTRQEVLAIYERVTGHAYAHGDDEAVDAPRDGASAVLLLGDRATRPELTEAAHNARYLHIATHGIVESGSRAMFSRLALSQPQRPTADDTGFLTLMDLFSTWTGRLRDTEMVVLSACDSLGSDPEGMNMRRSEGTFGLPWGFMYAGSAAVIASLWPVDDDSTAELMADFYARLTAPAADDERPQELARLTAFTEARRALKIHHPNPFAWAPFIHLGDGR